MTPTAEAIYAMTDAEYRAWQSERTIRHQRRTESPSKRAIRRAATRAGYIVTSMRWTPVGWRAVDEWDDSEIRAIAEEYDGRTLDGGWEVWLVDADGNEELVQQYQLDLTIEAIARLAERRRR